MSLSITTYTIVRNLCKGFLNRINLVLRLKGGRLEPEHLRKKNKNNNTITYNWEIPKELPNMRVVYNNKKLYKFKKKEMKIIISELKKVKNIHVDRMKNVEIDPNKKELEYSSIIRTILKDYGIQKAMEEKTRIFNEIKKMLNTIKRMSLLEYIEHLKDIVKEKMEKQKTKKNNEVEVIEILDDDDDVVCENSGAILDDIYVEQKISNLLSLKKVDKHIRYRMKF